MDDTSEKNEMELDVSWYPTSIEELHELLTFYRKQTIVFKNERKEYENILSSLKMSHQEKHELEWELHKKCESNQELKKQLSDTHILLYKEKNSNISFESDIKSLSAEIKDLKNDKLHLLQLLQSANNNINDMLDPNKNINVNKKHKRCKACNHNHKQRIICNKMHNEIKPQQLTTIYLPNHNAETIQIQLEAKEEELKNLKEEYIKINEYLINDRNKTHETLEILRNEYDIKFQRLQEDICQISKQHLFNLKQYLSYRRKTKQEITDLKLNVFKIKQEHNKIRKKYNNKMKNMVNCTNKIEKKIKKESNKLINGFRIETVKKHQELNIVKDELKTLTKSYQFDMNSLKNKLTKTKKKNKKLNQINKCQKIGVETDVENLKKRLNKLQKTFNNLYIEDNANNSYHISLQKEIDKISNKLLQLAKITES